MKSGSHFRKMRIAVIGTIGIPATYGGVERHVDELYSRLAARGHDVTVYCRSFYTPASVKQYNGIKLIRYPTIRRKHFEAPIHGLISTAACLCHKYDVVHYHAMFPALFSAIPHLRGAATVVTLHGLDWQREKWGYIAKQVLRLGEMAAIHWPDATIVVSQRMYEYFKNEYESLIKYIPNGVVTKPTSNLDFIKSIGLDAGRYILYVAKLSPEKGPHFLIDAFAGMNTDLQLVLAGGSRHSDKYAEGLKIKAPRNVKFLGFVTGNPLAELFSHARFVVQPSTIEGLAISILEAMGYSRCVLCSDIPENVEAIGECGVTFRNRDVMDLREKMMWLASNDSLTRELGSKARERVTREYDWNRIVAETEAVLLKAIEQRELVRYPQANRQ
jgi:glycosyltransferase involved in cell wall biosynthesis